MVRPLKNPFFLCVSSLRDVWSETIGRLYIGREPLFYKEGKQVYLVGFFIFTKQIFYVLSLMEAVKEE